MSKRKKWVLDGIFFQISGQILWNAKATCSNILHQEEEEIVLCRQRRKEWRKCTVRNKEKRYTVSCWHWSPQVPPDSMRHSYSYSSQLAWVTITYGEKQSTKYNYHLLTFQSSILIPNPQKGQNPRFFKRITRLIIAMCQELV